MPPQCNVPALTPRPGFLQAPGELARGGRGRAAAGAPVSARAEARAFGALRGAAAAALAALPTSLQQDEALLAQPSAAAALPAQPGAAAAAQGGALSPAEQVAAVPAVRTMSLQQGEAAPAACAPTFAGGRPARQRGCAAAGSGGAAPAPGASAVQGGQADAPAGSQDMRAAMPSGAARALRWRLALEWRASYKRRAHWPQVALGMCVQALSACLYSTKGIQSAVQQCACCLLVCTSMCSDRCACISGSSVMCMEAFVCAPPVPHILLHSLWHVKALAHGLRRGVLRPVTQRAQDATGRRFGCRARPRHFGAAGPMTSAAFEGVRECTAQRVYSSDVVMTRACVLYGCILRPACRGCMCI